MKRFTSALLALVLTFAFVTPLLAGTIIPAAPSVPITRNEYNSFAGLRITANNSSTPIEEGISFVADNRVLHSWYIHVTAEISGTIDVVYQISGRHFARTVEIDGPGRYIIGDSRGNNGLNHIKIGSFELSYEEGPPVVFHPVVFHMNDGSDDVFLEKIVQMNDTVEQPTDPVRPGFSFAGWFLDAESLDNPFDFSSPITSSINLFAGWLPDAPANIVISDIRIVLESTEDELVFVYPDFFTVGSGEVIIVIDNSYATVTIVPDMGYVFDSNINIIMEIPYGIYIVEGPALDSSGNIVFVIDAAVLVRRLAR